VENYTPVIVTTSWDDEHPLDLKVADLLNHYGIKGTFYVPLHHKRNLNIGPVLLRELTEYFEIGAHGLNHMKPTQLDERLLHDEIHQPNMEL
jgi:peptidoglycan-N-acetylglucosamine deacetylase